MILFLYLFLSLHQEIAQLPKRTLMFASRLEAFAKQGPNVGNRQCKPRRYKTELRKRDKAEADLRCPVFYNDEFLIFVY